MNHSYLILDFCRKHDNYLAMVPLPPSILSSLESFLLSTGVSPTSSLVEQQCRKCLNGKSIDLIIILNLIINNYTSMRKELPANTEGCSYKGCIKPDAYT